MDNGHSKCSTNDLFCHWSIYEDDRIYAIWYATLPLVRLYAHNRHYNIYYSNSYYGHLNKKLFIVLGYWQSRRNRCDLFVTVLGVIWIILNYIFNIHTSKKLHSYTLTFGYVVIILRFFTITGKFPNATYLLICILVKRLMHNHNTNHVENIYR